jgi:hypothetical protein
MKMAQGGRLKGGMEMKIVVTASSEATISAVGSTRSSLPRRRPIGLRSRPSPE